MKGASMLKNLEISLRSVLILTSLTGVLYPLAVTLCAKLFFPSQANGSLVLLNGKVRGSSLIAQKFLSDQYFHSRPSASDFVTVPSGASNLGPTSAALKDAIASRKSELGDGAPMDLLTASASGIDPHISQEAAAFQVQRIAKARGLAESDAAFIRELIVAQTMPSTMGLFGRPVVNVLLLNLFLDRRFPLGT